MKKRQTIWIDERTLKRDRAMTVLFINTVSNIGSTGRIVEGLGLRVMRSGGQAYVAFGRKEPLSALRQYRIGNTLSVLLHVFFTRVFDLHGFASWFVTHAFIRRIKEIKPDLIHLHNVHGYYLHIGVVFNYLARSGIPVVWTLHDCWSFTGHCSYFDYVKCRKWRNGCYECVQKRNYPKSLFLDNSKSNYFRKKELFTSPSRMTLVTPSVWMMDTVKDSFLNKYRTMTIYNGIDLSVYRETASDFRERNGLVGKKIILGVASIWEERKGLGDFIKLASIIDDDYRIVLVGMSEKQKKQVQDNILCVGRSNNRKEIVEIYSAADVFFNASVEESLGLTSIEAMACGTPVIAYNATAIPETVDDQTGFVLEPGDVDCVLEHVKQIISRGRSSYSTECRSRVVRLFDQEACYNAYYSLYSEILGVVSNA